MSEYDIWVIKQINARFRSKVIREVTDDAWIQFADKKQAKNSLSTRERFLNSLCAFLTWCGHKSRGWRGKELPEFERHPDARTTKAPARRRVADLTPELLTLLVESMPRHIIPQLAVEWSTGARVSSVLLACRLCDVILAEGRAQITFLTTKTGQPVTASLHEWAAQKVREYLAWRGRLEAREEPLFLDHYHRPYGLGVKGSRGRNKTAFNNGRKAAVTALRAADRHEDADLIAQVTQHWLRHWVATNLVATGATKTAMEQGGWLDIRSLMRYAHDVPTERRNTIDALPIGSSLTRDDFLKQKKEGGSNG